MVFSKGLVLLFAVHITLVASLKTKAKESVGNIQRRKPEGYRKFPSPDWCSATVTSNLGGLGPETSAAPELRYSNIDGLGTTEHVKSVDMIVTALSDYKTNAPEMNGFNNKGGTGDDGCFGIINLDDSSGDESVDLEFKFVESGTYNPVHIEYFEFLLFDIDMGPDATGIESFTVYDDAERYLKSPRAKFSETGDLSTGVTFTALTEGTGDDNPTDPDNLTPDEINKTVIVIYKHVEHFHVTFGVTGGNGARNFMFSGRTMSRDAPEASPQCAVGSCVIWGDPHVVTFDLNKQHLRDHPKRESLFRTRNWELDEMTVQDTGTYWIVNSSNIQMQGRYGKNTKHPELTSLDAFVVGGPFIDNNVLVFRPLSGAVTWNGFEILSSLPSEFSNRYVSARYHKGAEMVKDGSMAPAIEVNLPRGVKLTINRWATMLEAKIDMCVEEGQDGQCGNFNGDVTDDSEEQIMTRIGQKLLPHESMMELFPKQVKMVDSIPDDASTDFASEFEVVEIARLKPSEEKHAEASTDAAPECKDWCETHMDAWDKKCGWHSLVCSTCEPCRKGDLLWTEA